MKKKDKDAFIRSVKGALPLERNNTVIKPIPKQPTFIKTTTKKKVNIDTGDYTGTQKKEKKPSLFKIEKTQINKKLKKGKIPIDKKIDFHGMSVSEAEELFIKTVTSCYKKNMRCLLFVTGKGIIKKTKTQETGTMLYYGKIRTSFFSWVNKENIQKYILSFEQADIQHGADGAFFVYLRKPRY